MCRRSGLSTGKVVAIAVSTFVVGIIFAVALLCLLRRRIARFIRGPQQPPENAGAPPQTPQTGQMQQPLLNLWGPDFSDVSRTTPQTGMRPSDGQASPPSPSSNPMSQETLQPLHTFVTTTGPVQLGQVSPIHQQQQLLPVRQTPSPHQGSPPPQVLQHLGIPQDGPTFQGGPFAQSSPFAQSGPPTQSAPIQGSHAGPYPGPYQGPHPGQAWTNPQAPIDAGGQNMAPLSSSSPPRSAQSPPPPFSPAPGYSFVG